MSRKTPLDNSQVLEEASAWFVEFRTPGVDDATRLALEGSVLPVWIVAGLADWWCHRRTDIEHTSGATEYFAPARLEAGVASEAASTAASAFGALELRDVARADLIVDAKGRSHVLEVNVSPSMTETSLLPMAAHAAGMELSDLWDRLVRLAIERRAGARD